MMAAYSGTAASVAKLLEAGADAEAANATGRTALMIATRLHREEVAALLGFRPEEGAGLGAFPQPDALTPEREAAVEAFVSVTGVSDAGVARAVLEDTGWRVEAALDRFYAS